MRYVLYQTATKLQVSPPLQQRSMKEKLGVVGEKEQ